MVVHLGSRQVSHARIGLASRTSPNATRFMNLCDPMRHLVTADPDSTSYLPIDDEEWDSGVSGLWT